MTWLPTLAGFTVGMARAAQVQVEEGEVDLVSGLLWSAGVSAVGEEPVGDGTVVLRVDLPAGGVAALVDAVGGGWTVSEVEVDDGADGWRGHASVVRAGRVVVHPPWVPLGEVAPGEVVIEVDPGATFGHGAHPTTRLCLAALDRLLSTPSDGESPANRRPTNAVSKDDGPTVLDVGCGSGVLAVAAVLLGAAQVTAVDIDPVAVETTRTTAAVNGVDDRVTARLADPSTPETGADVVGADVVVANIGAATLRDLAPMLVAATRPEGVLVVSGLLDPPPPDLATAFAPLVVVRDDRLDGWTALTLARPGRRNGGDDDGTGR